MGSNLSFGSLDRSKVTKNNVAKGARAARLQRSKMVLDVQSSSTQSSFSLGIFDMPHCHWWFFIFITEFVVADSRAEKGGCFTGQKSIKWIKESSQSHSELLEYPWNFISAFISYLLIPCSDQFSCNICKCLLITLPTGSFRTLCISRPESTG